MKSLRAVRVICVFTLGAAAKAFGGSTSPGPGMARKCR